MPQIELSDRLKRRGGVTWNRSHRIRLSEMQDDKLRECADRYGIQIASIFRLGLDLAIEQIEKESTK